MSHALHCTTSRMVADAALLILGRENLRNLNVVLADIAKEVTSKLYVRVAVDTNFYEALSQVYLKSSQICEALDVRVLIDEGKERTFKKVFTDDTSLKSIRHEQKPYSSVVLGGTFDRLHCGHKLLLSKAVLAAKERIVCGVTSGEMIKRKILWELMEPFDVRGKTVKEFVEDVSDTVRCEVHEINDPFGPSIVDPDLEAIIVSEETIKGGKAVNQKRQERGLSILDMIQIKLLDGEDEILNERKLSSSVRRRDLLGTFLKPLKLEKCPRPFVIGLTGGIASGKTSAADFLAKHGCEVINCDLLAHDLYRQGSAMADRIADTFGKEIVPNGIVDRKALGKIVFADKAKLQQLNEIVWPSLQAEVKDLIAKSNADIVVVDAEILLQAGWDEDGTVNQVWSCIVPPESAVERMIERDKLTTEEAKKRLDLQVSNYERVQRSDVVICPLWAYEETRRQLKSALDTLRSYITR